MYITICIYTGIVYVTTIREYVCVCVCKDDPGPDWAPSHQWLSDFSNWDI